MARATTTSPTMLITKKAGPSPESANAYSSPQTSQRGCSDRKPLNRCPRPQRGQRARSPVETGGGRDRSYVTAAFQRGNRRPADPGTGRAAEAALYLVPRGQFRQCPPALAPAP